MQGGASNRSIVIDCHCHTFNANDLPLRGFLEKVVLNADERILPNLILPIANILVKVAKKAPDFRKERNRLDSILQPGEAGISSVDKSEEIDIDQPDEDFEMELRKILYDLEISKDKDDKHLYLLLKEELGLTPEGEAGAEGIEDVAKALWNSRGIVSRYIKWIKLLTSYRYRITRKLLETYTSDGEIVDLFTPALIDYDLWVDDKAKTNLSEQIQLMERNIRYQKGKIHPYFPFDPWRESQAPESDQGSLFWLKEAINRNGFIGAKLYPPMGYSAIDNNTFKEFPDNAPLPPEEFGMALDNAMRSFFAFCQDNDVPILTHCADSNETEEEFGERAHPRYWVKATSDDEFPKLRVCLGHFGGLDSLDKPDGWAWKVGRLIDDSQKNIYADISHFGAILQKDKRKEAMDNLERLFNKYPNAIDRIVFGTDWIMLARVRNYKKFLKVFKDAFNDRFGSEICQKFMGTNAATFLGLSLGQKTRARLEEFYEGINISSPAWINLV